MANTIYLSVLHSPTYNTETEVNARMKEIAESHKDGTPVSRLPIITKGKPDELNQSETFTVMIVKRNRKNFVCSSGLYSQPTFEAALARARKIRKSKDSDGSEPIAIVRSFCAGSL